MTHLPRIGFLLLLLASPLLLGLTLPPRDDADHGASAMEVFLPDEVAFIDIEMSPATLDSLINDPWDQPYRRCSLRFRSTRVDTTLLDVGIRPRGNTSLQAIKKSWKLSFNAFVPGRKLFGLEQMNVNGEHNDVSIIRSRLASDLYLDAGVPAARTHHVRFKINDGALVDGLYIHVEQVDEELVQAWFGNKDGSLYKCLYKGARADLRWVWPGTGQAYADLGGGETYEEKNLDAPNHADLADFIDFVNHADLTLFTAELAQRFSLDNFLRSMAVDVVIGHWDNYWYGANNYYLYGNTDSGRFDYLPYDLDNSYGVDFAGEDWSLRPLLGWGNGGYGSDGDLPPLIRRILDVDAFEDQLSRYVLEVAGGPFSLSASESRIDAVKAMIGSHAFMGSFADGFMDWGYTSEMFMDSYDTPELYRDWAWGWDQGLKPFIAARESHLTATVPAPPALPQLVINEFQASNTSTLADDWGEFDDWVELYNAGEVALPLAGLCLSDEVGNPRRFVFPDTLLPPGGHLLLWCDGQPGQGPWHAPFKLNADGEELGLFLSADRAQTPLDTLRFGPMATDLSLGRFPDGCPDWRLFESPSPGWGNDSMQVPGATPRLRLSAYPNPFNPGTALHFTLSADREVSLRLYDVAGRRVRNLIEGETLSEGIQEIPWDGRDDEGRVLPAGVYLALVEAEGRRGTRRLILLK